MIAHTPIKYFAVALVLAACTVLILARPDSGHANPSFFVPSAGTSSATSSPQYMTPGTATTTEAFNACQGTTQAMNSATLQVLVFASSTNPVAYGTTTLKIAYEYSKDGITWSQSSYLSDATSTQITLANFPTYNGVTASATSTPTNLLINVPTPLCRVRAVASIPAGSVNGAVWMQFIGKRENN